MSSGNAVFDDLASTYPPPPGVPRFGESLRRLRGSKLRAVVVKELRQWGLSVSSGSLFRLESGLVRFPDPCVLWGLCRLYHYNDLGTLVMTLLQERVARTWRGRLEVTPNPFTPEQI